MKYRKSLWAFPGLPSWFEKTAFYKKSFGESHFRFPKALLPSIPAVIQVFEFDINITTVSHVL